MIDLRLQEWADRVLDKTASFNAGWIDPLWAQRYAVAVDDLNPVYFDDATARAQGHPACPAPPNYVLTMRGDSVPGPSEAEMLEDGLTEAQRPPVPGLAAMGGGQKVTFHAPVYQGENIMGTRTIRSIDLKDGRSGRLVIVTEEIGYTTKSGPPKVTLIQTTLLKVIE